MAAATINIKKTNLKKALCAMKVKGVKPKSMVSIGDEIITEVDYKNPKDLYEVGELQNTLKGDEYKTDELIAALSESKK